MTENVDQVTAAPGVDTDGTAVLAAERPATTEAAGTPEVTPAPVQSRLGRIVRDQVFRFGMVWVMIALMILSDILYPGFFSAGNLNDVVGEVAPVGIVAVGMTFVIIGGGFDLSVGAVFAVSSVVYALLGQHMPLGYAFVLTVFAGLLAGMINGIVITVLRVNTFIATLATSSLFSGAAYLLSNSNPIVPSASSFTTIGTGKWAGIWISSYFLVGVIVVLGIALARTTYGRSVYSIGGNEEASRLAGMRTSWIKVTTFMFSGACAAIAGMITASQTDLGSASFGTTTTLDAIAIVIVGGTSLMGGEGAMWRTAVGILIWGTITNLFTSLALSTSTQLLMEGGILLVAVALDSFARRSQR